MVDFFAELTGIEDETGRVGNHPWRIEAEDMILDGYELEAVQPVVSASKGLAIVASAGVEEAWATVEMPYESGTYNIAVNYFDTAIGNSTWELHIGDEEVGMWFGDAEYRIGHSPSFNINGVSGKRITFENVRVLKGDAIKIVGRPDGLERAALDYISLLPEGVVD